MSQVILERKSELLTLFCCQILIRDMSQGRYPSLGVSCALVLVLLNKGSERER